MGRSTVHYADNKTNNALKKLHNKLRPAGTPVQRVEYIIELLLLRIFEAKLKQDEEFRPLRELFSADYKWKNPKTGVDETNENRLFSYLPTISNEQILSELNGNFFPFYSNILTSARQVFKGNLPQKVQDQLVLIEEVFSNSNFTNNVNSGNLGEVIGIVANEIEETRLLKTDLLGDAIESALSETGGTKDVGLFRTPDHIRQFMTALVEPTFDDLIFDPACGTAGFLFDAFEFVMRRADPDRKWPGEKAHSELSKWFDIYFKFSQLDFPSIDQSRQFYRSGVTGIEYLGMIRKMAAINFYIRGLNPANIEQGDSLAKYSPVTDHESKSIVLANPPFGAQRDQESYPDVWGEFSKESETTILFVKLMFEQLKQGGKCAVVVSEGFNTWDQFSAKALRKMLLDEAQLRAVISLPQGLFVSKNGQGPKTSILVFEKGGKTDWTWFYKISNDGYTMGTNRKEQKGNQLVECLELWHEYVKHGKKPPESKHQFCIAAEWIKTLDPRIKEKIRTETRADMESTGADELEILRANLAKEQERLEKANTAAKKENPSKTTLAEQQKAANAVEKLEEKIRLFPQLLQNRIQNEIAKRIEKAHNYSFNLANYKSTISDSQIAEWTEALKHIQPNGTTNLEEVYKKLCNGKPENSLPYLLKLNPSNALEADIAREFVSNLGNDLIAQHHELRVIREILKSKQKYPIEKLEGKVEPKYVRIRKENYDGEIDIIDKISFKDGKIHFREEQETGMDLYQAEKGNLVTSKINVHQGALALADKKLVCSTHYQVYEIDKSQINPEYLIIVLRSKQLQDRANEIKNGGIKNEQGAEFLLSLEIPLPSLDEQNAVVAQIERQKAIIEGTEKVLGNWEVENLFCGKEELFYDLFTTEYGYTDSASDKGNYRIVRITDIGEFGELRQTDKAFISVNSEKDIKQYQLQKGDIVIARTGATFGKMLYYNSDEESLFASYLIRLRSKRGDISTKYIWYFSFSTNYWEQAHKLVTGGTQPQFNANKIGNLKIPLPPLEVQHQIVAELDAQMAVLEGLRKIKLAAEQKINQILSDIWGVESTSEPVIKPDEMKDYD